MPLLGVPDGPLRLDLVPTATDWSDWAGIMVTRHFDLVSGLFWAPRAPKRARFGPQKALLRAPEGLGGTGGSRFGYVPFSRKF